MNVEAGITVPSGTRAAGHLAGRPRTVALGSSIRRGTEVWAEEKEGFCFLERRTLDTLSVLQLVLA